MTTTPRFGLHRYGGSAGSSASADNSAFSNADRITIDALFSAFETHNHKGGVRLADPSEVPALTLIAGTGTLPASTAVYYRVSFIDQYGLETAASHEVAVLTSAGIATPAMPTAFTEALDVNSVGGGLMNGMYYYCITAVDSVGHETTASAPVLVTVTDTSPAVRITFPDLPVGADHFAIYRRTSFQGSFLRFTDSAPADIDFVDDGTVSAPVWPDGTGGVPASNQTGASNSVTIAVPDSEIVSTIKGPVIAWRVYRTYYSGAYDSKSMVSEVRTTLNQDGTGGLVITFLDDGSAQLLEGQPKDLSQTLTPSVKIVSGGGTSATLLTSSGAFVYRLFADVTGALITRASSGTAGHRVFLTSPDNTVWLLTCDDDGVLVTSSTAAPTPDDVVYIGTGPELPCSDPTVSWQLGVANDGALITLEL